MAIYKRFILLLLILAYLNKEDLFSIDALRLREENKEQFLKINREAEHIYREYGAIESETFTAASIQPEYGCSGMVSAVELRESEVLMLEINRYHNKVHHSQVMEKVDNDERLKSYIIK